MNTQQLRAILEHTQDDLEVKIAGLGDLSSVRCHNAEPWVEPGLYLDVRGPMLQGRFRDKRTLLVRLEGLGATA